MTSETRYLQVAVPTPLRQSFHYSPPKEGGNITAGVRVRVPFGRRKQVVGVLLGTSPTSDIDPARIRPASAVLDDEPVISDKLLKLCEWAADYYHHPVGEVFATA
ncbi:MAG: primosomal protein N', partial [Pseudomonadales bacterium]|nr:primosomal protein N' [Pseudomonadales bacterium]